MKNFYCCHLSEVCWNCDMSTMVVIFNEISQNKTNSVALVRMRTIPTERPPTIEDRGCRVVSGFLDRSCYYFFQVAPQLYSRGSVNSVPEPLILWKSGSTGNRTWDLWIYNHELWPLDHRGDHEISHQTNKNLFYFVAENLENINIWRTVK
jgi:hypothetical protein